MSVHKIGAIPTGMALVLRDVPKETHEIATVSEVLKQLVSKRCIVTMDAAHCQTTNSRIIVEQNGDYVLTLKENQGTLCAEVRLALETKGIS